MYTFNFDTNRVLTTVFKVRINVQLSSDGQAATGTTELVIMDGTGKVSATVPGGTYSGVGSVPRCRATSTIFKRCSEGLCARNTSANHFPESNVTSRKT